MNYARRMRTGNYPDPEAVSGSSTIWILCFCSVDCFVRFAEFFVGFCGGAVALFCDVTFWRFRKVFMYFLQVSIEGWGVAFFLSFLMRVGGVGGRSNDDEDLSLYGFCSDATRNFGLLGRSDVNEDIFRE